MVALAAAVGTLIMLGVLAIAHSEAGEAEHGLVSPHGMSLLLATVVVTVGLPVLVLAATAGRLAAAMRDRRLANLRLLGMSAGLTRLVAAVETGAAAVVGAVIGAVGFLGARPALVAWHPAGRHWESATLTPTIFGYAVVLLVVPGAVTLVSASPARASASDALATARHANARRPSWWRVAPLLLGAALATYVFAAATPEEAEGRLVVPLFAAIVSLGVGIVLVVPSFVRLVADLLVRGRGPATVIAGRRLQDQPASTSRVVSGLLIGLFVVTGARAVVVAFEQTPQFQAAATLQTTGQTGTRVTGRHHATSLAAKVAEVEGIRDTEALGFLRTTCAHDGSCLSAVVGTCDQLVRLVGPLPTCREGRPAWLGGQWALPRATLSVHAVTPEQELTGHAARITAPRYALPEAVGDALDAQVFIPRGTPGVRRLVARTSVEVIAAADAGVPITSLSTGVTAGPGALILQIDGRDVLFQAPDMSYFDFVSGLRQIVWSVAAVVLSVGLLAFAIGAVDRAMSRRAELICLRLAGVSPRLLRRTQWIEAALPLGAGVVLAVGLGTLAGACYLAFGTEVSHTPWRQSLVLAGVSAAAAAAVAGLTVVAASPRIRADLIRTE